MKVDGLAIDENMQRFQEKVEDRWLIEMNEDWGGLRRTLGGS